MHWYQIEIKDIFEILKSSRNGLSSKEAARRLQEYGPNKLKEVKKRGPFMMFLDQFRDFMILVLIAAAVVSGLIGEPIDALAIVVIVMVNAAIGFIQEYRAEKAIEALKEMAAPTAVVLRDSKPSHVPASELVPGDVVLLEAGKIVPADMRLIESARLKIEEAALTGESVPVEKVTEALREGSIPLGDRKNMAYKGTTVSYGRGVGIVVETGMNTELGRIATLLQEEEEVKTPLQKRLARFGQRLGIAVLAICAVVFITGFLRGEPPLLMFLTAVSLAVAAIPEALPAVVTISLAIGAKKMVKQRALVRKLPAVETLGSVTYICSDKTGTLTMNRMTVGELYVNRGRIKPADVLKAPEDVGVSALLAAMCLNNDAVIKEDGSLIGDPTETPLLGLTLRAGYDRGALSRILPREGEIPFDSSRKRMTTIHRIGEEDMGALSPLLSHRKEGYISFTKGSVESLIERSRWIISSEGGQVEMDSAIRREIEKAGEEMATEGLRTLGFGMRLWERKPDESEAVEDELIFLGIAGLLDPPRPEAAEAVKICKSAGIRVVMITGDHPLTAREIARRLEIISEEDGVITGEELDRLSMEEFEEKVDKIRVYARVAPEQKIKIVKALQDRGEFVAMTGDGVNDAPALKRADIGVAMGITGTDVAKEASHMILLDDNFATIVKAVREGRKIFDNIRKFIKYTMTSNSGEIWTIFLAPFLGLPIPLLPIHILWINLVTDGLPGLALVAEPEEKGLMERPPRHPRESIFAHGMAIHIVWVGLLMGGLSLFMEAWAVGKGYDKAQWQTMVFTVLCLNQMGHVLAIRAEKESIFRQGLFSNRPLVGAVLLTFALQMATIYVPFLNPIFKTAPLDLGELLITLILSTGVFFAVEIEKWWLRRRK